MLDLSQPWLRPQQSRRLAKMTRIKTRIRVVVVVVALRARGQQQ
jgi:hypothetical protein